MIILSPVVLEWIGYIASLIVLISLLMSSLKKLRWINLVGSLLFGTYGFLIGSVPTGLMNVGIALINIYYLIKMYGSKEYFKVLFVDQDSSYLKAFIDFYKEDIYDFKTIDYTTIKKADIKLFILRDMAPASVFVANKIDDNTAEVMLDYAIPMYRDFKLGKFLFVKNKNIFENNNIQTLITKTTVNEHVEYLRKMGFKPVSDQEDVYKLSLQKTHSN